MIRFTHNQKHIWCQIHTTGGGRLAHECNPGGHEMATCWWKQE